MIISNVQLASKALPATSDALPTASEALSAISEALSADCRLPPNFANKPVWPQGISNNFQLWVLYAYHKKDNQIIVIN